MHLIKYIRKYFWQIQKEELEFETKDIHSTTKHSNIFQELSNNTEGFLSKNISFWIARNDTKISTNFWKNVQERWNSQRKNW